MALSLGCALLQFAPAEFVEWESVDKALPRAIEMVVLNNGLMIAEEEREREKEMQCCCLHEFGQPQKD